MKYIFIMQNQDASFKLEFIFQANKIKMLLFDAEQLNKPFKMKLQDGMLNPYDLVISSNDDAK